MFNFNRFDMLVKGKGITKQFIASKLEKNAVVFYDWSKGKSKPSEADLQIVCEQLDCSPEFLLGLVFQASQVRTGGCSGSCCNDACFHLSQLLCY